MNTVSNIFFILLFFLSQQKDPYYNKSKQPSTYGITQYIERFQDNLIMEYSCKIDTLFYIDVFTDDLSQYSYNNDLGVFFPGDNIIVLTNEEKYIEYEYNDLSKIKQKLTPYTDRTVKAVLFHELTHAYFYQIIAQMKMDDEYVSSEYGFISIFPQLDLRFGAEFIEEGVCEYVVYYLNESSPIKDSFIPKTVKELIDPSNEICAKYHYSVYFIKEFLDENGIENGIKILVTNRPPNYNEIINPKLFFDRLTYPSQ